MKDEHKESHFFVFWQEKYFALSQRLQSSKNHFELEKGTKARWMQFFPLRSVHAARFLGRRSRSVGTLPIHLVDKYYVDWGLKRRDNPIGSTVFGCSNFRTYPCFGYLFAI